MKYCPYCGAALPEAALVFCTECGKELPKKSTVKPKEAMPQKKPSHKKAPLKKHVVDHRKPAPVPRGKPAAAAPHRPPNPMDENYDGYYDDVPPADADRAADQIDRALLKRVAIVIAAALVLVVLSITVLMLL